MSRGDENLIRIGVADVAVTDGDRRLVTSGLGSCVGVTLYDDNGVGGLLHAMLPEAPPAPENVAKYVDSGVASVLTEMASLGADRGSIRAKLTGGSSMLDLGEDKPVGEQNVEAAIRALDEAGVEIVANDTGGNSGRSISFHPGTGTLRIKRVDAGVEHL